MHSGFFHSCFPAKKSSLLKLGSPEGLIIYCALNLTGKAKKLGVKLIQPTVRKRLQNILYPLLPPF